MPNRRATFRFHESLNDFLPPRSRHIEVVHAFDLPAGVRDMIQACGVPHVEVGWILTAEAPVGFDHVVHDGERLDVWPRWETPAPHTSLPLHPLTQPDSFVLDVHLGRLAGYLRLLGFDTVQRNDYDDDRLVEISLAEGRMLLTRDLGILKRSALVDGTFIRSVQPKGQAAEVVRRFDLTIHPFARCMACNGVLRAAPREELKARLPAGVLADHDTFTTCDECGRAYWPGSHYARLTQIIADVATAASA